MDTKSLPLPLPPVVDLNPSDLVSIVNNEPRTTSLKVAEAFGKRHDNVIRSIETLDSSEGFNALNFEVVKYQDKKGEIRKVYNMTKDGFMFLVMGFTGAKAATIKEAYINAFNQMARTLLHNSQMEALTPSEQRTIQELVQYKTNDIDPTSRRKAIAEIYSRLGQKFRVAKYSQIPRTQFAEAITYIMEMTLKASAHKKTPPQNTLGEAGSYLIEQYSLALKQLLKHQDTTITTTIADHIQQKYGQPIRQIPTTEANLIFASLETLLTNAMRAWLLCSNIERWVIAEWEGHKTDMPQPIRQTLQTNNHYDPNALSISRNINQQAIQMITTQPQLN